jgi:uncharacterized protein YgbK (DUF1537 family)
LGYTSEACESLNIRIAKKMNEPILGCIADDLTGATDLCNNLVRAGMRVMLAIDVPAHDKLLDADAIVVALKSRTIPAAEAVAQSLHACRWLRKQGVRQIYFKVCSTFDSTPKGNIGPVIEALMDELACDFSTVVPAFPDNDRTVYHGHLFVGDVLLSDSGMRNHPLTPMTDANLVRFLQLQLSSEKKRKTGLIDYRSVTQSAQAICEKIGELRAQGVSIAIADAISNSDLQRLASALHNEPLVTAGSGDFMLRANPASYPRQRVVEPSSPAVVPMRLMHRFSNSSRAEEQHILWILCCLLKTLRLKSSKSLPGRLHAGIAIQLHRYLCIPPRSRLP